jgi:hypothetical protein
VLGEVYGGAGSVALIRPDGHLAAWRSGANPEDLADLVDRASGSHLVSPARTAVPTGGTVATDE